jgi:aminoglycoside phosphotransferase family enzyme/predicted kinase
MVPSEDRRRSRVVELMQTPDFYPHPVDSVTMRETHISLVFLTGDFVYKIKKPVNLDFLDFTTLEQRQHFCSRELELNRRLTHDVYLDVVAVTCQDEHCGLDGPGRPVEYAVKMRQLPDAATMQRRFANNKLDSTDIDLLARVLDRFYRSAPTGIGVNAFGQWSTVRRNCEENFSQTEEFAGNVIDRRQHQIIKSATRAFLRRRKALFDLRVQDNKIREGHGDLRTDHIYFTEDGIQIVDCIEFNRRFRCGDIASDLAFLAMDLDFAGHSHIAGMLVKAYMDHSGDGDVMALMDFYKCYRAFVRAKVDCLRLKQAELADQDKTGLRRRAMQYLELAYEYAQRFSRPTVWVVCGMIASGKSTVAAALAAALQIKTLRSDVVRKQLFEQPAVKRQNADFGEGIYGDDATALTYGKLLRLAQEEIAGGNSVLLDATFSRKRQRREVSRLAADMEADILFIECRCGDKVLRQRLAERDNSPGVSDARLKHLNAFKARYEALDEIADEILIAIDTELPIEENLATILARHG